MRNVELRFYILSFVGGLLFAALLAVATPRIALAEEPTANSRASLSLLGGGRSASSDIYYGYEPHAPRIQHMSIPQPSHKSVNKLLRIIKECEDSMVAFPYELVVYPELSWDVRFDLTPSTFRPFYRYKEAVLDASYDDVLGCAEIIDELSEKEQAMVLVAIYLVEKTRRIFPEDPRRNLNDKNPFIRFDSYYSNALSHQRWDQLRQIVDSFATSDKTAFPAFAPDDLERKWEEEFRNICSLFVRGEMFAPVDFIDEFEKAEDAKEEDPNKQKSAPKSNLREERRQDFFKRLTNVNSINWESICQKGSIHFLYSIMLTATQPEFLNETLPLIRNDMRIRSQLYSTSPGRFPSIYVVSAYPQFDFFREYLLSQFCAERRGLSDVEFSELYVNKSEKDLTLGKIARDLQNHRRGVKEEATRESSTSP